MSSQGSLLGIVLITRHGDRRGFYQNGTSYTPSGTSITPLGTQQMKALGTFLRSTYLDPSSSEAIPGISFDLANQTQIAVRADAGGEGGVIWNSALSLLQGLYPETGKFNETLANGTTITGATNGYQFLPVESVEAANDVSLEGWTECGAFDNATKALYASDIFKKKGEDHAAFLNSLPQYLDGREVSIQNMIFDFMNVQSIHDAEFAKRLPATYLAQARDLANFHEYSVFSSQDPGAISNIAARTMIPSILARLSQITTPSSGLKFAYSAISYKPFIGLFNMTGAVTQDPSLAGIVNYAAAMVLEVRDVNGEKYVQMKFKNGTDDDTFRTVRILGSQGDAVKMQDFRQALLPYAINSTESWCTACGNTEDRGCDAFYASSSSSSSSTASKYRITPVGAGFLGAGLTFAVMLAMFGMLFFLGCITFKRKRAARKDLEPKE
ncbi:histidine phosphatase superfamily [Flagelloscypha sp. PMI_526]|nr:histidine phosphatase superfamily [Flagelloscypha sp. PMI_526]